MNATKGVNGNLKLPSIKHADTEKLTTITIVTAIIIIISCVFLPVVMIYIMQDVLFFSRSNWFLSAPTSAYFMFGFGMLWIPIILTALVITKMVLEKSGKQFKLTWLFSLLMLVFIPIMGLGIYNYYYFDDDGIHYNHLSTYSETSYYWNEIQEIQPIEVENNNGTTSIHEYIFITENGDEITIPYHNDIITNRVRLNAVIDEYDIVMQDRILKED
ncbi:MULTISPECIES: hypothetical protein [Bacillaceae]|uniref:Uncharacterized protein n=1 Tax=Evansella alkalicola TaxID=745819 RepID=A0ABS6JQK7_9BACI|nr:MULTISPECIES: hypothetical protein [Bacillaceae]MBU9720798.1 hypothetical protein [Bacillus alkalicola]